MFEYIKMSTTWKFEFICNNTPLKLMRKYFQLILHMNGSENQILKNTIFHFSFEISEAPPQIQYEV